MPKEVGIIADEPSCLYRFGRTALITGIVTPGVKSEFVPGLTALSRGRALELAFGKKHVTTPHTEL